ncbi:hypothetical protein SETIT_9G117200v2 [Setaria italica]|uniref:WASH1 WAHD domain-containing protein n=1 Tax=Setaria italica TaxID=4555 RepID=A0A368SFJ5_SETIT|nr:uncharacterized protein LOC101785361 [Setaria italica]RCV41209.1 hypothetical protein SETIT_9G117200v2 [Setaria italica]
MLRVSEDGDRRRTAHAAGYGDLGRTLLDLQAAADQIFDAVTKRTAEEREKLSGISTRIKAAKAKIKALSQSEEPLTIVSPACHPSSSTKLEDFRPLFHDKYGSPIANIAVNGGFNREYGLEGTLELFQFFSEENCDYPSKAADRYPKTKDATYLENILEAANHQAPQKHLASDTKSEELPPPPPSLLPKHLRSQRSDGVRVESDVNPSST